MSLITKRNYYVTTTDGKGLNVMITKFVKRTQTYHAINVQTMQTVQFKKSKVIEHREKRKINFKVESNGEKTYLYIFKTDNDTYKFGSTTNVVRRQKEIRTTSAMAVLMSLREIPSRQSENRYKIEKKFQKRFDEFNCKEGGKEMFKMSEDNANNAIKQLKNMRF